MYLFCRFLRKLIRQGCLRVVDVDGHEHLFGLVDPHIEPLTITVRKRSLYWKLALHPGLFLGEAYMAGEIKISHGSIYDFLALCGRNMALRKPGRKGVLWRIALAIGHRLTQWNSLARSRRNVAHHYDLARDLYRSFLDRDMQYSCGYFPLPDTTLDEAQAAKRRHIVAKLILERNQRVLDIGCGWGGLAIEIAKQADVRVDGVTLSREQLQFAGERAKAAGVVT